MADRGRVAVAGLLRLEWPGRLALRSTDGIYGRSSQLHSRQGRGDCPRTVASRRHPLTRWTTDGDGMEQGWKARKLCMGFTDERTTPADDPHHEYVLAQPRSDRCA